MWSTKSLKSFLYATSVLFATLTLAHCFSKETNNGAFTATTMAQIHDKEFNSPQVNVKIECQRDKTIIKLNFTQPFNGILGTGSRLDLTKCKINGNGTKIYELNVLHNSTADCGTQWDNSINSILNTLFIRFHSSLETGNDIVKNVICRLTVGDLVVGKRPVEKKPKSKDKNV